MSAIIESIAVMGLLVFLVISTSRAENKWRNYQRDYPYDFVVTLSQDKRTQVKKSKKLQRKAKWLEYNETTYHVRSTIDWVALKHLIIEELGCK